ncbi:MAG: DNA-directed RNA polymerase subunit alpha [Candidatus Uhrbacteria bacterium GW2011_GWD2_52_7]|uniref:DNA-directed RNA polymerase subunit alpha n=1 Tax=Candidatus Uhrbacteria bacterium GW2011_GWD2_52_7 TaxID=1618989 RepID=A0A0G1XEI9_9BACT|nr:MAG: DNA-directed RNA polymerase subunit alpha [Candidatus Uhrbacteria bacterium GW2011_GWD2_52_7]
MESIFLPSKMYFTPGAAANESTLTIEPLHHGYGTTVGNALRRVLLSSLPGAAVIAMKIKGVQHEFSTVPGVKEDVLDIMLNLKKLRMKVHSDEPVVLKLTANKAGAVNASMISPNADVEIANPDLQFATLTEDGANFEMEITVAKGRGYVPTEEREKSASSPSMHSSARSQTSVSALRTPALAKSQTTTSSSCRLQPTAPLRRRKQSNNQQRFS